MAHRYLIGPAIENTLDGGEKRLAVVLVLFVEEADGEITVGHASVEMDEPFTRAKLTALAKRALRAEIRKPKEGRQRDPRGFMGDEGDERD